MIALAGWSARMVHAERACRRPPRHQPREPAEPNADRSHTGEFERVDLEEENEWLRQRFAQAERDRQIPKAASAYFARKPTGTQALPKGDEQFLVANHSLNLHASN